MRKNEISHHPEGELSEIDWSTNELVLPSDVGLVGTFNDEIEERQIRAN